MKVLAIQGSPRKNGNTDIVLDRFLDRLREAHEADMEKLRAPRLDIGGCIECFACQKTLDAPACAVKDDMTEVYDKMLDVDLIVFASPVFCWGLTAQIKAVFDRLYATFKFTENPCVSLLEGKCTALIVTAGGDKQAGATACQEAYDRLFEFARAKDCGTFLAPLLKEPADTAGDRDLLARAAAFADEVAEAVRAGDD